MKQVYFYGCFPTFEDGGGHGSIAIHLHGFGRDVFRSVVCFLSGQVDTEQLEAVIAVGFNEVERPGT